jgi:hypothetical protein
MSLINRPATDAQRYSIQRSSLDQVAYWGWYGPGYCYGYWGAPRYRIYRYGAPYNTYYGGYYPNYDYGPYYGPRVGVRVYPYGPARLYW